MSIDKLAQNISEDSKAWKAFRTKYHNMFIMRNGEIHITNDIFERIETLTNNGKPLSGTHKANAFCFYVLAKLSNMCNMNLSIGNFKEAWGFNKATQTVDALIKKDGILDKSGLTQSNTIGIDTHFQIILEHNSTVLVTKKVVYDVGDGNFFRVPSQIMLGCMFKKDLGPTAFYVYCLIMKYSQHNRGKYKELALSQFVKTLGLSKGTVEKYLNLLSDYYLIKTIKGKRIRHDNGELKNEMNRYKPEKILSSKVMSEC